MTQPNYPDTAEGAAALLKATANSDVLEKVRVELEAERVEWIPDPSVKNVWGLALRGSDEVVVVVYLHDEHADFEINDSWVYGW